MPAPWDKAFNGRFEHHVVPSRALESNPLGDPSERPLWVYLPPGYGQGDRACPVIYVLQGLTGQVDMWWNRSAFRPTVPELVDEVFSDPETMPAVIVFIDAWTSLGGSQFLNSPGTGRYMDYVSEEVVAFVDERYRTLRSRDHRGLAGKSSGGYGSMALAMLRPDVFGGFASHAGDALFEVCYLPDFRRSVRVLRDDYQGSFDLFWKDFRSRPAFSKESDFHLLNDYCMAACYSAEDDGTVRLPYNPATGRLVDGVWERWLEKDPVRMAPLHAEALTSMRGVWIDGGRKDQFYLELGAQAFSSELSGLGIDHRFELFRGTHSQIEHRYPAALAYLSERLS